MSWRKRISLDYLPVAVYMTRTNVFARDKTGSEWPPFFTRLPTVRHTLFPNWPKYAKLTIFGEQNLMLVRAIMP